MTALTQHEDLPSLAGQVGALRVTDSEIAACLGDGRSVSVPLAWSWRLSEATLDQREHWELIGDGACVH